MNVLPAPLDDRATFSSHAANKREAELVSVIIPARNAERFLARTIASACAQTYPHIEVLIVDDRSIDQTGEIALEWSHRDCRVRLITSDGAGVSAARNTGLVQARGQFIATLDADDLWHPDKLARQVARLNEASVGTGLVYCWSAAIDEHDRVLTPTWAKSDAEGSVLPILVRYSPPGNGSSPLMRRSVIKDVGGYDPDLAMGEDSKLYIAMAAQCQFAVVPASLVGYRLTDGNTSLGYAAMERAINGITSWIETSWPAIGKEALSDRAAYMTIYLAVLAIRRRHFSQAIRYWLRSVHARPAMLLRPQTLDFWGMWLSHRLGLNWYDWRFWRPRAAFLPPSPTRPEAVQTEHR